MIENATNAAAGLNLGDVLFNAYHRRLLELLLLRPHQSLHLRDIARRTGISAGSLHRELRLLTAAGLLRRTRVGSQVHYQANADCSILKELTAAIRKLAAESSAIARVAEPSAAYGTKAEAPNRKALALDRLNVSQKALAALCRRRHVQKLSLFGSIVRDDFTPGSDVDVLVEFTPGHGASLTEFVQLRDELSELFGGRRVDIATKAILKNPYRRAAILKDLQALYVAR